MSVLGRSGDADGNRFQRECQRRCKVGQAFVPDPVRLESLTYAPASYRTPRHVKMTAAKLRWTGQTGVSRWRRQRDEPATALLKSTQPRSLADAIMMPQIRK